MHIFLKYIFSEQKFLTFFFVRNFCLSSIFTLEFRCFFENGDFPQKLAEKQKLLWPISADIKTKHCKDINLSQKQFLGVEISIYPQKFAFWQKYGPKSPLICIKKPCSQKVTKSFSKTKMVKSK